MRRERRDLGAVVDAAIAEWGRAEHGRAVLVKGSAGITGLVPLGGDLDLLIVTDIPPGDDWFAELRIDGVPVEVFVRDEASLEDRDQLLRHGSLPIELVENLHIHDPHGILARAREAVRPRLLDAEVVRARASASFKGSEALLRQARESHLGGQPVDAARYLSVCLWHGAAAAASAAGFKPTTRRCLVVWAEAAERLGRRPQVRLLESVTAAPLDSDVRNALVDQLAAADDRVGAAVEGMVTAGEDRWVAFPLLTSVLWSRSGGGHAAGVGEHVLSVLDWGPEGIAGRIELTEDLLRDLGQSIRDPRPIEGGGGMGPEGVVVRDADTVDIPRLVALKGAGSEAQHLDRMSDARRGGFRYLVLARPDGVVGFGCLVFERPPYWSDGEERRWLPQLVDLQVAESERRRGLGTYLIRVMERLASRASYREVYISADVENRAARSLYRRLGYRELNDLPRPVRWSFEDSAGRMHSGESQVIDMVRDVATSGVTRR